MPVHVDTSLRPGLTFMTFHFPDDVATNLLTIDRDRSEVGDGGVQGGGGGDREIVKQPEISLDLHIVGAEPTGEEREAVDALLGPAVSDGPVARETWRRDDARMARGGLCKTRGIGATCCCRRCMPFRIASDGSAAARSTTSASA